MELPTTMIARTLMILYVFLIAIAIDLKLKNACTIHIEERIMIMDLKGKYNTRHRQYNTRHKAVQHNILTEKSWRSQQSET